MQCFSIVSWLRRFANVGPQSEVVRRIGCPRCRQNLHHARLRARAIRKSKSLKTVCVGAFLEVEIRKICTTPARESDSESKIVKNSCRTLLEVELRKICTASARERFISQNREALAVSEHFWKLTRAKFAPRLRARAIWKSIKNWHARSTFGSS